MINLYCRLIIRKARTFDNVPEAFKEPVKQKLKDLGYDTNGNPLPIEV